MTWKKLLFILNHGCDHSLTINEYWVCQVCARKIFNELKGMHVSDHVTTGEK